MIYLNTTHYLVVVDYFSNFPKVMELKQTTSQAVINAVKSIFSRHGVPSVFVSDNGPQYSSTAFEDFAKEWEFHHITLSPLYPQSNGLAEKTVKLVKRMLAKI